ncbi:putative mRNA capping methyltransferase [Leptomonas pyrrhocoris]|uniref:mRNA (guanine-N(7))-methyltransferase n=1 Tax=Leptomonas pyrrhocoris TaxID=157538 RepID=A0A0N0DV52_LEPPY|nr:putative mRNA capping methyltransferase [Leptomonas pyrrhocoris]KPA79822.1 putative mRNA capping methyltransferase [Leptomonas pyrrhocoris]|eukprot:XP_015658261.1 putative mRNA capping methyltransferase [Leptomonas pyrrhocoris]
MYTEDEILTNVESNLSMNHNDAAASYDDVTRQRKDDRSSQQVAFRHFNNFVKKSLIQFALDRLATSGATEGGGAAVLDIASGRGGDVGKWVYSQSRVRGPGQTAAASALKTVTYDCYDVSPECIHEAERRFTELVNGSDKPLTCDASFSVADCFADSFLQQTLPSSPLFGHYHVVTIQFAFHYACQSSVLIRDVLSAVSNALVPGGVVLITTVDAEVLSQRAADGKLGNELYEVTFPEPPTFDVTTNGTKQLVPCTKYHFHLEGFVDCAEYVVCMEMVTRIAREVGLNVSEAMTKPFSQFVHEYASNWKLNKGNKMSPSEYELVTLYRSICFEKQRA